MAGASEQGFCVFDGLFSGCFTWQPNYSPSFLLTFERVATLIPFTIWLQCCGASVWGFLSKHIAGSYRVYKGKGWFWISIEYYQALRVANKLAILSALFPLSVEILTTFQCPRIQQSLDLEHKPPSMSPSASWVRRVWGTCIMIIRHIGRPPKAPPFPPTYQLTIALMPHCWLHSDTFLTIGGAELLNSRRACLSIVSVQRTQLLTGFMHYEDGHCSYAKTYLPSSKLRCRPSLHLLPSVCTSMSFLQ